MANSKQTIGVNLQFNADVSQAKQQIQALQMSIDKLLSGSNKNPVAGFNLTSEIEKASNDVIKLQSILRNTTLDNGKLDLTSFRQEMSKAGLSADKLRNSLTSFGPEGTKAFSQLAQSVMTAETPLRQTNVLLNKFADTLKKTAEWQISSSVYRELIGSIQKAYSYAQDLDKSLNSIRVVTGQSAEQMADFAKQANKAAKALSTTTTAYTDASLIFYQQGLTGEAVTERTNAVIKMSNVTGQSAEEVSSYMTAIWNNFDDGSQSLEHYADVITALGASTASSSAEIAQGLEKFAAVGETVGLSYEYATSALATVVAQTRQSADTVGTAFKTIFSRIQGLSLGETLDDGVTLNKYSQALEKVGVSIIDSKGQMKDLDTILDSLATKWDVLTSAQRTALAQTVAGTRQYNQLIALMDNWDSMQENLNTANNSNGALQKQADIYEESWEAAKKRLQASFQGLYDDLLDEDFFIKLTDGLSKVVDIIDSLLKALGGVKNLIPMIAAGLTGLFKNDMIKNINAWNTNRFNNSEIGKQKNQEYQESYRQAAQDNANLLSGENTENEVLKVGLQEQLKYENAINEERQKRLAIGKDFTQAELDEQEINRQILADMKEELQVKGKLVDATEKEYNKIKTELSVKMKKNTNSQEDIEKNKNIDNEIQDTRRLLNNAKQNKRNWEKKFDNATNQEDQDKADVNYAKYSQQVDELEAKLKELTQIKENFNGIPFTNKDVDEQITRLEEEQGKYEQLIALKAKMDSMPGENIGTNNLEVYSKIVTELDELGIASEDARKYITEFNEAIKSGDPKAAQTAYSNLSNEIEKLAISSQDKIDATKDMLHSIGLEEDEINNLIAILKKLKNGEIDVAETQAQFKEGIKRATESLEQEKNAANEAEAALARINNKGMDLGTFTATGLQGLTSLGSALSSITSLMDTLSNPDASGWDKFLAILTTGTMSLTMLSGAMKSFGAIQEVFTLTAQKATLSILTQENAEALLGKETYALVVAKRQETKCSLEAATASVLEAEGKTGLLGTIKLLTKAILKKIAAQVKEIASNPVLLMTYIALAAAIGTVVAIYKAYTASVKAQAQADADALKRENEKFNAFKEERENLEKLKTAYEELIATKDQITDEELKNKAYELCMQYGEEALAVQVLAGAYKDLNDVIEKLQSKNLGEQEQSATRTKNSAIQSIRSTTKEKKETVGDEEKGYDFRGLGWTAIDTQNGKLKEELKILAQKAGIEDYENLIDGSGHTSWENISKMMSYNGGASWQDLAAKYADTTAGADMQTMFDANKTAIDSLININNEMADAITKDAANTAGTISNYTEFLTKSNELAQKLKDEGYVSSFDEGYEKAKAAYGIDNIELLQESSVIDQLMSGTEATAEDKQKLAKVFEDLGEGAITSAAQHIELIKLLSKTNFGGNISKAVSTYFEKGANQGIIKANAKLEEAQEKQTEAKESGSFSAKVAAQRDVYTAQENLNKANEARQAEIDAEIDANYDKIVKTRKLADEIETKEAEFQNNIADSIDLISSTLKNSISLNGSIDILGESYNDRETIIKKMLGLTPDQVAELDEDAKAIYEEIQSYMSTAQNSYNNGDFEPIDYDYGVAVTNFLSEYGKLEQINTNLQNIENTTVTEVKNAAKYYDGLQEELANYTKTIKTAEEAQEEYNSILADFNTELDSVQGAYKTLRSAQDEYNQNSFLSMDTVQSLMKLDDQYINTLELTDSGLKINKESYVELTKARYLDMAAEQAQYALETLQSMANDKAAQDELDKKSALDLSCSSTWDLVDAKLADAEATWAEAHAEEYAAGARSAFIEAQRKKIEILKKSYNSINTNNLDKFMGASSSSKTKKRLDDEFDRYYAIKEAIEDIEDAMSDLQKMQEHVHGKALIQALEKQNQLLDQQKAKYEELYEAQKAHAGDYQATLARYGAQFSETGDITNYAEITKAMVDKYNSNLGNEKVEKDYEFFKKMMDEYLSLLDEMESNLNKIDDIYYEQLANNLSKWETDIQINLDLKSAEREWQEFLDEINKDFMSVNENIGATMSSITTRSATYLGNDGTIAIGTKAMQDIMREIEIMQTGGKSSMFASISEAQESLKEYLNTFQDDAKALYQLVQDAWDAYNEGCDQAIDKFNDLLDEYEKINNSLEHQGNMIELIYGENAYGYLSQLYDAQVKNIEGQINSLKVQIDFYKNQYNNAVKEYGADSEVAQKWKEAWEEATDELYDREEAHVQKLLEVYKNTVNKEFDDLDKRLTGGVGTSWALEQWDLEKKAAEDYYDSVERVYQIETMESKWEAALNKTSSLKAQQKLRNVMDEQMRILENKTELTKYDVELAEKRLAVAEAEIALEEAQNNKNTMKLTRGTDGNWAYQYVADEDDIAKKQQDLADAQYNAYEYVKENLSSITEQTLQNMQSWQEAIKEIQLQMATATEEERIILQERLNWYNEYYSNVLQNDVTTREQYKRDMQIETTGLLLTEYNIDLENYNRMTEDEKALLDAAIEHSIDKSIELYENMDQTYSDITDLAEACCIQTLDFWTSAAAQIIDKWAGDTESVKTEIINTLNICRKAQEYYTNTTLELYGYIEDEIITIIGQIDGLSGATKDLATSTASSLQIYQNNVNSLTGAWAGVKKEIENAAITAQAFLKIMDGINGTVSQVSNIPLGNVIQNLYDTSGLDKTSVDDVKKTILPTNIITGYVDGNKNSGSITYTNDGSWKSVASNNDLNLFINSKGQELWITNDEMNRLNLSGTGNNTDEIEKNRNNYKKSYKYTEYIDANNGKDPNWEVIKYEDFDPSKRYDTGGYTGDWSGGDGRLAMLHSKELVLNQEDTKNILSAVSIIRNISNIGNSIANGMHNMMSSLLGLKPNEFVGTTNTSNENTDNTFNITMNVDGGNVEEIKTAILNLPNLASQYLGRR